MSTSTTSDRLEEYLRRWQEMFERGFQPGDEAEIPWWDTNWATPRDSGYGWRYVLVQLCSSVPPDHIPKWHIISLPACHCGLKCRLPDDWRGMDIKRVRCISRGPKSARVEVLE